MKNIADVNSDDILTELNNLDYAEDDLKLLDDEDIRPINNKQEDDLADFYMDYDLDEKESSNNNRVDLFTEQPKVTIERPVEKNIEKNNKIVENSKQSVQEPVKQANIDSYLNRSSRIEELKVSTSRSAYTSQEQSVVAPKTAPVNTNIPNPLINNTQSSNRYNSSATSSSKVEVKDLNQLFNKVSNNVKGASEIVNRNAEIKKKIEEKFEELRRLQLEHEANKKKDYEEINAYKDEVYAKLQQKKTDIERDLVDLRTNQEKFKTEKNEFETYKNNTLANLKKVENDLKVSYENRNKNIEQVELGLVKRKEQLDLERATLAKEREQIEKEREELAANLVQFNKLVDDFTNGIDNFD